MEISIVTVGLAYLAGMLSTLSPCVLPLIPIVLGSAIAAHRFGALALNAGLMLSFTLVGMFLATVGTSLGLNDTIIRHFGASLLMVSGVALIFPMLQARLATATSGVANAGQALLSKVNVAGLQGQFLIGLLLGTVWGPCVGPTLGAAVALASQGKELAGMALLMATFGLGAGTPLLVLGALSRSAMLRLRGKLMTAGSMGKRVLGAILLLLGTVTFIGLDKRLEAQMVQASPAWLIDLTTRF